MKTSPTRTQSSRKIGWRIVMLLFCFGCSERKNQNEAGQIRNCLDTWVFESNITERKLNDSVTQEIDNGRVWFDIINPTEIGGGVTRAYIKNYRMDGSILSEGYAEYYEHPILDYREIGLWNYYNCDGEVTYSVHYTNTQ